MKIRKMERVTDSGKDIILTAKPPHALGTDEGHRASNSAEDPCRMDPHAAVSPQGPFQK